MTEKELDEYFKNPDKKDWDEKQIFKFWEWLWRSKTANGDFSFHGFVFPTMIPGSFGNPIIDSHRDEKTHPPITNPEFVDCKFLSATDFNKRQFRTTKPNAKILFENTIFMGDFNIKSCSFSAPLRLKNIECLSLIDFSSSTFLENVHLELLKTTADINFHRSKFAKDLYIDTCQANEIDVSGLLDRLKKIKIYNSTFTVANFSKNIFSGEVDFRNNLIKHANYAENKYLSKVSFTCDTYHSANFRSSIFPVENITFFRSINGNTTIIPRLDFSNISSFKNVIFRNTPMNKSDFNDSNLLEGDFNATFHSHGRLIIGNETLISNVNNYHNTKDIYRQLKHTFERDKNWDLAAKAFRSEMLMKRRSLFEDISSNGESVIASFEWLFHFIYEILSGYNQSAVRPLLILLGTIGLGAYYYSYFESNTPDNGLQMSFGASFPYFLKVSEDLTYDVWWIKLIQTFLSSILIAFFIIALRKKFKQ